MKDHIHHFKYIGSGTNLVTKISDVDYKCDCGIELTVYLPKDVYSERKYMENIICDIYFPEVK